MDKPARKVWRKEAPGKTLIWRNKGGYGNNNTPRTFDKKGENGEGTKKVLFVCGYPILGAKR